MDGAFGPDSACIVISEIEYCLRKSAGNNPRFKDPPPADMKPDADYEPKVGEWFWYRASSRWKLRFMKGGYGHKPDGESMDTLGVYKLHCLPATPPA